MDSYIRARWKSTPSWICHLEVVDCSSSIAVMGEWSKVTKKCYSCLKQSHVKCGFRSYSAKEYENGLSNFCEEKRVILLTERAQESTVTCRGN